MAAPLVASIALRSNTADDARIDDGTTAVVGVTVTAAVAATAPAPNETDAAPSVLAAMPPVVGETSAPAGGPRPLPGTAAGSDGGRSALAGAELEEGEGVLVDVDDVPVAGLDDELVPAAAPVASDVPAPTGDCVSWSPVEDSVGEPLGEGVVRVPVVTTSVVVVVVSGTTSLMI
jgi:hypothetical protein